MTGLEAVVQGDPRLADGQGFGVVLLGQTEAGVAQQGGFIEAQAGIVLLLQPAQQAGAVADTTRQPLFVERELREFIHHEIAAPEPRFLFGDGFHQHAVMREKVRFCAPLSNQGVRDQGLADEQLAGDLWVNAAEVDLAAIGQRQTKQPHTLAGLDPTGLHRPAWLVLFAAEQVLADVLDPLGLDLANLMGVKPGCFQNLACHDPAWRGLGDTGSGKDSEMPVARTEILAALIVDPDLVDEAAEHGSVQARDIDLGLCAGGGDRWPTHVAFDLAKLTCQVFPLAHPHEIDEMPVAPALDAIAGFIALGLLEGIPELEQADEIGLLVRKIPLRLIRSLALVSRPVSRILNGQAGAQNAHDGGDPGLLAGDECAPDARVQWQPCQLSAEAGDLATFVHRFKHLQQANAVTHVATFRRVDERKRLDLAQLQVGHRQQYAGEIGPADFRIGEHRPVVEIILLEQAHAHALGHATAASRTLPATRLGDRFDGQALHARRRGVAGDPGQATVDHVADARHGQRGFGDVCGQHDPTAAAGLEDRILGAAREPGVQRQHLGPAEPAVSQRPGQMLVGVTNVALAGQKHQDVASRLTPELLSGLPDRLRQVVFTVGRGVANLDRVGAALDRDDGCVVEELAQSLRVDGGRGDDQLEIRPLGQHPLEIAQQKVDVEAALVRLIDNDRLVPIEKTVAPRLRQQNAVGHQFDLRGVRHRVIESGLKADEFARTLPDLLGDTLRHAARREPARLGVADQASSAIAHVQQNLGQLRGLARAGVTGDNHHLVISNGRADVIRPLGHRQARHELDHGTGRCPRRHLSGRGLDFRCGGRAGFRRFGPAQLTLQAVS